MDIVETFSSPTLRGYPQVHNLQNALALTGRGFGNIDGSIALAWPFPQPSFKTVAVAGDDAAADAVNPAASDGLSGIQRCSRTTTSSTSSRRQVSIRQAHGRKISRNDEHPILRPAPPREACTGEG
nr:hypothetical protein [Sinorhizobium meliloti]